MAKILSKAGDSLADVYDVEGSIAGVENLLSEEVNLVHEMGATISSERMAGVILTFPSGAISQSTSFNSNFNIGTNASALRLLGIRVFADATARVARAQVSVTDVPVGAQTDMPVWVWNLGTEEEIRVMRAGSVINATLLQPDEQPFLPNLLLGTNQASSTPLISLRGVTLAFGAGTVTLTVHIYFAFAQLGGVSSRGLPLAGW